MRTLAILLYAALGLTTRPEPARAQTPGFPPLVPPRAPTPRPITIPPTTLVPIIAEPRPTRVIVSTRELRVLFPRDTTGSWGWSDRADGQYDAAYEWTAMIDGMDGPHILSLRTARTTPGARAFTSLASLVAAGRLSLCVGDMSGRCTTSRLSASVVDGRVVLTLGDPAIIARLFGLRQEMVRVWQNRPDAAYELLGRSVPVEYVAPQIPLPNDRVRAEARWSRRAFEESVSSVQREIAGGRGGGAPLWLVVGDSAVLRVEESQCRFDSCSTSAFGGASTWTVDDSSIVQLRERPVTGAPESATSRGRTVAVTARKLGRTTVRATLGPSPSDTLPSSTRPSRTLEYEVNVRLPIEPPRKP